MSETVPMSHPATAVKNTDGTWSVRIQHTTEGSVTSVEFTNILFAEVLAKGYADMLNGKAAVEAGISKLASDLGPAVADAKQDVAKLIADAEAEAQKLIDAAKTEAGKIKTDACTLAESAKSEAASLKAEASNLLSKAETEAEKLLEEARQKASEILLAASQKVAPPAPTPVSKTSKAVSKSTPVEDE